MYIPFITEQINVLDDEIVSAQEPMRVENLDGFQYCANLGYKEDNIRRAYKANNGTYLPTYICIYNVDNL